MYTSLQTFGDLLLPKVSQATIGGGLALSPDYFGSDNYHISPRLAFYVRIDNYLSLGTEGVSLNVFGKRRFQFGPTVNITGRRPEKNNSVLEGLGNIKASLDLGLYGKVIISDRYSVRLRAYGDVLGGDNGGLIDLTLSSIIFEEEFFSAAVGLKGTWTGKKRAEKFFGISGEQFVRSGLPEYNLGSSFSDVEIDIGGRWEFSKKWAFNGYAKYTRILGEIAKSPLIDLHGSANQFTIGTFITYTFQFGD